MYYTILERVKEAYMKKLNFIWLWVIIFLFFQFLSAYSSEIKPSAKAVNEETDGCICRGDLDRNGVINPVDLEYMAKVIQHEIIPDPSLAECADLNYNGLSYEMSDYTILQSWMSAYHVILCGKEKLTLASLKISEIKGKPCDKITLPIFIRNDVEVGAFDLQIEFDGTLLYFKGAERGEALTLKDSTGSYQWEYFTYRQLPIIDPLMYRLEILGLYDIKNTHKGIPLQPDVNFVELAKIKFQITCDNNLCGTLIPVNFYWNPNTCTENSLCDQSGNILYVSNDTSQFNFSDCDTSSMTFPVVPSVNFENGFVNILEPPVAQIGDIDLNGVPYEIGDATLFANSLLQGISVFTIDPVKQIRDSDIDGDGAVLTLSDFLLLIRIMQGKALPGDSTGTTDKVAYFNFSIRDSIQLITFNSEAPIGAILFTFDYTDTPCFPNIVSTDMDIMFKVVDSHLKVLVYSFADGINIPPGLVDLLAIPRNQGCRLQHLEVVDDRGKVMKAIQGTTGISDQSTQDSPKTFTLFPNYPNPFNPDTYIEYALPTDCQVTLVIYNILGQRIRTLINSHQTAGFKSVRWDGKDNSGNQVSAGVYFYSIKTDNFIQTKKMLLLK
jgi:hypothetical protein